MRKWERHIGRDRQGREIGKSQGEAAEGRREEQKERGTEAETDWEEK